MTIKKQATNVSITLEVANQTTQKAPIGWKQATGTDDAKHYCYRYVVNDKKHQKGDKIVLTAADFEVDGKYQPCHIVIDLKGPDKPKAKFRWVHSHATAKNGLETLGQRLCIVGWNDNRFKFSVDKDVYYESNSVFQNEVETIALSIWVEVADNQKDNRLNCDPEIEIQPSPNGPPPVL